MPTPPEVPQAATLTEDEFDALFPYVPSPEDGSFFSEWEHVKDKDPAYVWTAVDGDDGGSYLIPNVHYVNRFAYVLTTVPWPHENIEVRLD